MKKIINNNHNFFVFLILAIFISATILIIDNGQYYINDDFFMSMISSGVYGTEYSQCLIYSNAVLGWFIRIITSFSRNLNWYMFFQYALITISSVLWAAIVNKRSDSGLLTLTMFLIYWSFVIIDLFIRISFTMTAGLITIVGIISLFELSENNYLLGTISLVLVLFGFLYRKEAFLLVSPYCLVYFLYKFCIHEHKQLINKNTKKLLLFAAILIIAAIFIDAYTYRSDEWKEYKKTINLRTKFIDYNRQIHKNTDLDWSENDYIMFSLWKSDDEVKFGSNNLSKLINNSVEIKNNDINQLLSKVGRFYTGILDIGQITLIAIIILIIIVKKEWNKLFFVLAINVLSSVLTVFFEYNGRFPDRVALVLWVSSIVLLLLMVTDITKDMMIARKKTIALVGVVLVLFAATILYKRTTINKGYNVIEKIRLDPEHMYVLDVFAFTNVCYEYSPLETIDKDMMNNMAILGSWPCPSPLTKNICLKQGGNNSLDLLGRRDDVLYILNSGEIDVVEKYLQENYDVNIKKELVEKLGGGLTTYRFIHENLVKE